MTTVPLPSPYGTVHIASDGRVDAFDEKPVLAEHPINAGFLVMEHAVFDVWPGGDLESAVLPALAASGALFAYRHPGFWKSMDTYKDALALTELCRDGRSPWQVRA